jgi:MFS family permease
LLEADQQVGSWYKNEELFKRAGVWFMGNSLGSMFSGYLQSAIRAGLGGVAGRAAWRWLFLVQGIITLPICILGYLFWFFSDAEHALAVKRIYHVEQKGITWSTFKYTLKRPMWWIAVPCYMSVLPLPAVKEIKELI